MPLGARSRLAAGMSFPRSPAHRTTTTSNRPTSSPGASSTRALHTRTPESPNSRTTVERNDARRWRDSIRTTSASRRTILIGIPGMPAPEPRSARHAKPTGRTWRKSRLSRRSSSTIHSGSAEPTSRWIDCHFNSKVRYLLNRSASESVRGRARIARAPSRSRSSGSITGGRLAGEGVGLRRARRPSPRDWRRAPAPDSSGAAARFAARSRPSSTARARTADSGT